MEHPHETKLSRGLQNSLRKKAKSLCQHRLSLLWHVQRIFYCGNCIGKSSAPTAAYCRN